MRYLVITILINFIFSITTTSAYTPSALPINAKALSMASLGVASDYNNWINPASLGYSKIELLEFSQNSWIYDDVSGANISYRSNQQVISYHYWKIDDIFLYEDIPSDAPLGSVSSQNIFLQYSRSFNIKSHYFGLNMGARYVSLFDWEDKGLNLDLGYQKTIRAGIKLGIAAKNIFSENKNSDKLPKFIAIGVKKEIYKTPFFVYLDLFKHENNGFGSFQAIKFVKNNFDLICGVKYLEKFDSIDISLGFNFNLRNLQFSISTLLLENSSFQAPVSYQISYLF